jgi:hypothetical protein
VTIRNVPPPVFMADDREFERISEGRYQFVVPELSTDFDVQHVRRERHQLFGEVTVYCGLKGVQTYNGVLFTADVNLSSLRDREQFTRTLASRTSSATETNRWAAIVSELAVRIKQAEEVGSGVVNLKDVPRPDAAQFYRVGGLLLPHAHPALLFGDGDSLKTYIGDHILLKLGKQGVRSGIADWELEAADHRDRGERLIREAPDVFHWKCTRPLIHEADRLARDIHEHRIQYLLVDSAAPACNGRPEDSENASAFFRALRTFGIGSLIIGHTNRSEQADQKPFGSVFWFNLSRAIWYVKRAEAALPGSIEIGLYPRKFNLGAPQRPTALKFTFTDTETTVTSVDIAGIESLAAKLPLKDRIAHLVRVRARTIAELAAELHDEAESISRTIRRYSGDNAKVKLFTRLPDERIALLERRVS